MTIAKDNEELKNSILDIIKKKYKTNKDIVSRTTQFIECLSDQNQFNDLNEVMTWFKKKVKECSINVEKIGLKDIKDGWYFDKKTGDLVHESGGFFSVTGVKVSNTNFREVGAKGWEQPIIDQGAESGIAGILRKKFNGVPHYLLEAKVEPGNYGKVQLSPTLQATFSNLKQLHKGRKPHFSEYFENPEKHKLIYGKWLPEDGGRFYLKRTYNMLVEIDEKTELEIPDSFIWVTMYQIKELLKFDNLVNPHVRSIIAHL